MCFFMCSRRSAPAQTFISTARCEASEGTEANDDFSPTFLVVLHAAFFRRRFFSLSLSRRCSFKKMLQCSTRAIGVGWRNVIRNEAERILRSLKFQVSQSHFQDDLKLTISTVINRCDSSSISPGAVCETELITGFPGLWWWWLSLVLTFH